MIKAQRQILLDGFKYYITYLWHTKIFLKNVYLLLIVYSYNYSMLCTEMNDASKPPMKESGSESQ